MVDLAFIPLIAAGAAVQKTGIGSKIGSAIGGLFGGKNTNPEARALADKNAGKIIRLGAPPVAYEYAKAAPEPGTFYISIVDGQVYQSKADGMTPVMKAWATQRKAQFQASKLGLKGDEYPGAPGGLTIPKIGTNGLLMIAAVVGVVIFLKVRR